jgi:hypothetical protein
MCGRERPLAYAPTAHGSMPAMGGIGERLRRLSMEGSAASLREALVRAGAHPHGDGRGHGGVIEVGARDVLEHIVRGWWKSK